MYSGHGSYYGGRRKNWKLRKAAKSYYRERRAFPPRKWGTIHVPRSTSGLENSSGIDTASLFGNRASGQNASQMANRKLYGFRGDGGYSVGNFIRDSRRVLGGNNIDRIGSAITNRIVRFAGGGEYTGHGNYENANNLIEGSGPAPPSFSSSGDETGAVTIRHTEYITDVYGPAAGVNFNVQAYTLNPALESTFPFLSQIAANYDQYEFVQMIWEYRSTTTDIGNSTTGQCGTVVLCTQYNAQAPVFGDKASMMEYAHAHSCKVTENMLHGVECDPVKNTGSMILKTRSGPQNITTDLQTYDLGIFQLAICNSPAAYANNPIGELWCAYTVRLRKPKLFVARGLNILRSVYISQSNSTAWFNDPYLYGQQNNIAVYVQPKTNIVYSGTTSPAQTQSSVTTITSLTFPAAFSGNVRITVTVTGTALVFGGAIATPLGNITMIPDVYNGVNTLANSGPTAYTVNTVNGIWVIDCQIEPATSIAYNTSTSTYSGGNNVLSLNFAVSGSNLKSEIDVMQYNSLGGPAGLSTASALPVLLLNGTNVQTSY